MDDLAFSIHCLSVSFKRWHNLEEYGLAQAKNENRLIPSIFFRGHVQPKPEFRLLFNPSDCSSGDVEELGQSNHSVVYGKGLLAYKVIHLDLMSRPEYIIGSLRELAFLHSFGMARVIMHPLRSQWSLKNGSLYTVIHEMARSKCTLYDCLKRHEFTGLSSIKTAMTDVLVALHYLHDRGVVHGDIKPHNILITHGSFHTLLTDFTLTHFEGRGLIRSAASACWKAPELDKGATYTKKADIWAWGITWMDCLHGCIYGTLSQSAGTRKGDEERKDVTLPSPSMIIKMSEDELKEWEDLRNGVLEPDPEKRWSTDQILRHPWFKNVEVRLPPRVTSVQWEPSEYENMKSQATAALFLVRRCTSESWLIEDVTVLCKRLTQHLIRHSFRFQMEDVVAMCVETVLFLNGYLHVSAYQDDALFWSRIYHVFHILNNRLFDV